MEYLFAWTLAHTTAFNVAACSDTELLRVFQEQIYLLVAKGASWSEAEATLLQAVERARINPAVAA